LLVVLFFFLEGATRGRLWKKRRRRKNNRCSEERKDHLGYNFSTNYLLKSIELVLIYLAKYSKKKTKKHEKAMQNKI